ncbi:hypothetical protein [uncultured Gammaproteobacteria bacterium]|nr:hypothetical protein [uncultured Gammaproteobacteria bacterium]
MVECYFNGVTHSGFERTNFFKWAKSGFLMIISNLCKGLK